MYWNTSYPKAVHKIEIAPVLRIICPSSKCDMPEELFPPDVASVGFAKMDRDL
jgi:hypothetical protein